MEPGLWGVRGGTVPELRRKLFCIITIIEAIALNLLHFPCAAKLRERHRVCHTPQTEDFCVFFCRSGTVTLSLFGTVDRSHSTLPLKGHVLTCTHMYYGSPPSTVMREYVQSSTVRHRLPA